MNCNSLGSSYRWWEYLAFGSQLQKCRTQHLNHSRNRQHALVLGEGDGRFLTALLTENPGLQVDCIDSSSRMIELAQARVQRTTHPQTVHFQLADAQSFPLPPARYDLIVTHFFLDCFDTDALQGLVSKISASTRPGAIWLLADFHQPPAGLARIRAQAWLRLLYTFFALTTNLRNRRLCDPSPALQLHGFKRIHQTESQWKLLKSEVWRK